MFLVTVLSGFVYTLLAIQLVSFGEKRVFDWKHVQLCIQMAAKEFIGSILLYVICFTGCTYLGSIWYASWIYHAFGVFLLDKLTGGVIMNPVISICLWINNNINAGTMLCHLCGQFYASSIAWFILESICSIDLFNKIKGPNFNNLLSMQNPLITSSGYHDALLIEFALSFFFTFVVFYQEKHTQLKSHNVKLFVIALSLRICMIAGGKYTGANFNPMVCFGWFLYDKRKLPSSIEELQYIYVYFLAPVLGGICAVLFASFVPPLVLNKTKAPEERKGNDVNTKATKAKEQPKIEEQEQEKRGRKSISRKLDENEEQEDEIEAKKPKEKGKTKDKRSSSSKAKKAKGDDKAARSPSPAVKRRTRSRK